MKPAVHATESSSLACPRVWAPACDKLIPNSSGRSSASATLYASRLFNPMARTLTIRRSRVRLAGWSACVFLGAAFLLPPLAHAARGGARGRGFALEQGQARGAQRGAPRAGGAQRPYAAPPAQPRDNQPRPNPYRPNPQAHLGEWMSSHGNLPLAQQQRALEQEPGFQQLRPEVQQHLHDQVTRLNNMTPERRQQAIANTEAMERLTPDQRQQIRSAAGQLGTLPEDRRRAVARAFRDLRSMPDAQRQTYLNSPQFRGQFNDQERDTLNHLLTVSPFLPMPRPNPMPGPQAPPQFE